MYLCARLVCRVNGAVYFFPLSFGVRTRWKFEQVHAIIKFLFTEFRMSIFKIKKKKLCTDLLSFFQGHESTWLTCRHICNFYLQNLECQFFKLKKKKNYVRLY